MILRTLEERMEAVASATGGPGTLEGALQLRWQFGWETLLQLRKGPLKGDIRHVNGEWQLWGVPVQLVLQMPIPQFRLVSWYQPPDAIVLDDGDVIIDGPA